MGIKKSYNEIGKDKEVITLWLRLSMRGRTKGVIVSYANAVSSEASWWNAAISRGRELYRQYACVSAR